MSTVNHSFVVGTLISCSGLHGINLSRNLLGRTSIRVISISLRHQIKLRWLDLHGNFFFAYEEDATELAHDMAQGRQTLLIVILIVFELKS